MSFFDTSDFSLEDDDYFLQSCGVDIKKQYPLSPVELKNEKCLKDNLVDEQLKVTKSVQQLVKDKPFNLFEKFKFRSKSPANDKNANRDQNEEISIVLRDENVPTQKTCLTQGTSLEMSPIHAKRKEDNKGFPNGNDSIFLEESLHEDSLQFDMFFEDQTLEDKCNNSNEKTSSFIKNSIVPKSSLKKQESSQQSIAHSLLANLNVKHREMSSTPQSRNLAKQPSSHSNVPRKSLPMETTVVFQNSTTNSIGSKKTRKRRFPGPAGLLPDLPVDADLSVLKNSEMSLNSICSDYSYDQDLICSQASAEEFQKPPWQNMVKDLSKEIDVAILSYFNIKNMLNKAKRKMLPKHIVAKLLCVVLAKITINGQEADAKFLDETGEVMGKIDSSALIAYKEHLIPRAAIVLKKVSFLFNQLIVKQKNIVAIYDDEGKTCVVSALDFNSEPTPKANETTSRQDSDLLSIVEIPASANKDTQQVRDNDCDLFGDGLDALLQDVDTSYFEEN